MLDATGKVTKRAKNFPLVSLKYSFDARSAT
jgi:hypothetical protein